MAHRVERDLSRFRQIVRGKIKKDLRKYMSQGEMIGRQGRRYVSIPLPQIDIPQFHSSAIRAADSGVVRRSTVATDPGVSVVTEQFRSLRMEYIRGDAPPVKTGNAHPAL